MNQTMQAFVGGTGPGQVVGRQALAMNPVGEIEVSADFAELLCRIPFLLQPACLICPILGWCTRQG